MMRGGHEPIRQLQDLNWGAFNHASHAPQLRSCNYNVHSLTEVHMTVNDVIILIGRNLICSYAGKFKLLLSQGRSIINCPINI